MEQDELALAAPSASRWAWLRAAPESLRRTLRRGGEAGGAVAGWLEQELAERAGFQWMAVLFGAGALAYFTLPSEPALAVLAPAAVLPAGLAFIAWRRGAAWRIAAIVAALLAGATAGKLRVDSLAAPTVERPLFAEMTGRVVLAEHRTGRRPRIVLDRLKSPQVAEAALPRKIRLSLPESYGLPQIGSTIAVPARLMPVAGPVTPGGYDPRRAAWFEGIGASGFSLGRWQEVEPPPPFSMDLGVARIRAAAVARIMAVEPGEAGAVAAALLVGERSALSEETNESLRISGLAHILSISGLHMMLIAGTAFFAVRALLALSPSLTLSRPIRKWAAAAALLVVTVYLALSGGGAATTRAWVMAAIVFAAILADRPAISMRNLAIAAFIVLALEPEGIVEPGFQMSFAAVAALIAGWEAWSGRERQGLVDESALPGGRVLRWLGRALLGVALTTLIAGLATAPYAAYHFERVASYSLLGNLLAAPLVSVIIMPFGLLTLVLMPLGLEAMPLIVMARGIDALLAASDWVAALPGSEVTAPAIAPLSLLLMTAGLLWLCLWRLRWRLLGLPLIALGLLLIPVLADRPDILVAPDGKVVAVRDAAGILRVSGGRAGSYVIEQLFDKESTTPPSAAELRGGIRCDPAACLFAGRDGLTVSHVVEASAFAEDCRRVDVVLTPLVAPADCAALVVDAPRVGRFGAHAVRLRPAAEGHAFAVTTERGAHPRPWQAGGASAAVEVSTSAAVP